jgi:GTPase
MKKAVVISLKDDTSEIIDLAKTLDYNVIKQFIQHRDKPDVNSYIGQGKLDEIKEYIESEDISVDLFIVNGILKPSQWFLLEKNLGTNVFDRLNLILNIFENNADSKEARLQVKLAQLEYKRPFVREIIHLARAGEHPGFMAGGEYQVDDYYEMIKKQMKKTKDELKSIGKKRKLRRSHRHASGFYLVSLAGYTNAGKSSLLNLLTNEQVKVEGKLFSTLSTTTRKITSSSVPILLTDTVGFIRNLPAWVLDAFHSTLEEIELSDVVLLIADVSEELDVLIEKLKVSFKELLSIGVSSETIIVLNKSDLIDKNEIKYRTNEIKKQDFTRGRKIINISVTDEKNIDLLKDTILNNLPNLVKCTIKLPLNDDSQSLISLIYDTTHVFDSIYTDFVTVSFECNKQVYQQIVSSCKKCGGHVIE